MAEISYLIEHRTRYSHAGRVATSQHLAHLEPRTSSRQQVLDHTLAVEPAAASITRHVDYFGNPAHLITMLTPYAVLEAVSRGTVALSERAEAVDPDASTPWEEVRDAILQGRPEVELAAFELSAPSPYVALTAELADAARGCFTARRPVVAAAVDLMHQIHRDFTFVPHVTSITTPITRVLQTKHGVCQDFAHLAIGCLRSLGVPARYVSGYLLTDPPPGQARLVGADASHAWLSVHCPRLGWVDLDPTNDVLPGMRHITTAWGRDYGDVSPLRGVVLGGGEHVLSVGVSVMPV